MGTCIQKFSNQHTPFVVFVVVVVVVLFCLFFSYSVVVAVLSGISHVIHFKLFYRLVCRSHLDSQTIYAAEKKYLGR